MAAACCRRLLLSLRPSGASWRRPGNSRMLCTGGAAPAPRAFTDPEVQRILASITGMNMAKVFRPVQQELKPPTYKLLTDEQLAEAQARAVQAARVRLKPAPVLEPRQPIEETLAEEPFLAGGTDTANYVFTDISQNTSHRERFIAVREPSGRLRKARWEERDRMIQVYFPREGRSVIPPAAFQEQSLSALFSLGRHEHVLNLALAQFEPDSPDYIRVHRRAYEDLAKRGQYEELRSTRHFGGLAWHLARTKAIDGLLIDMIQRDLLQDAASLVQLYNMLHPEARSAVQAREQGAQGTRLIKVFMTTDALQAGYIELALRAYEEAPWRSAAS